MRMIGVFMPGKIIFLHPLGEFRRFAFQFFGGFQPVAPGRNTIHPFLIEGVR